MEQNKEVLTTTAKSSSVQYPYIEENLVMVKRVITKSPLPTKDTTYNPADDYIFKIGSSFKAGTTKPLGLYVLDEEEKDELMPQLIGISKTSNDYNKVLETYWSNISVFVPAEGLSLDCSIEHLSANKSRPVNIEQYVIWKYCLQYSGVANSEEFINKSPKIKFVLWNKKEQRKKDVASRRVKDEAVLARISLKDDKTKARSILYLFNKPVEKDHTLNILQLAELAEQTPEQFLSYYNDSDLLTKAFVQRCVNYGLLTNPAGSTLIGYNGDIIAQNMNEAVLFFKDIKNDVTKITLEAHLAERDK